MENIFLGDALDLAEFPDEATKLRQQMVGARQDIDQLFEARDVASKFTHENARRIDAHVRVNLVLHLSTITHLVEAKLISIDEAVGRIEQIHSSFADLDPGYANLMVSLGVKRATDWLRSNKKEPRQRWKPTIVPRVLDEDATPSDDTKDP